jgi:hypothetical protein
VTGPIRRTQTSPSSTGTAGTVLVALGNAGGTLCVVAKAAASVQLHTLSLDMRRCQDTLCCWCLSCVVRLWLREGGRCRCIILLVLAASLVSARGGQRTSKHARACTPASLPNAAYVQAAYKVVPASLCTAVHCMLLLKLPTTLELWKTVSSSMQCTAERVLPGTVLVIREEGRWHPGPSQSWL